MSSISDHPALGTLIMSNSNLSNILTDAIETDVLKASATDQTQLVVDTQTLALIHTALVTSDMLLKKLYEENCEIRDRIEKIVSENPTKS